MENKEEIWKDIEGYEGHYQVSNLGRVRSLSRTICKPRNGTTDTEFYCQLDGKIKEPQRIGPNRNYLATKVRCIDNGVIYQSISEAARILKLSPTLICRCCKGKAKQTNGLHFEYV